MRINHLRVKNFKGFEDQEFFFHPEFSLVVGVNGTGKTSVLDALAVAAGSWSLGLKNCPTRHIGSEEIRLQAIKASPMESLKEDLATISWEQQDPCIVEAEGDVLGQSLSWRRTRSPGGRTTYRHASALKQLVEKAGAAALAGKGILPLISHYGAERLKETTRDQAQVKTEAAFARKSQHSRLAAYRETIDLRISVAEFVRWFARQSWITFQQGREPAVLPIVRRALTHCIEGAKDVYFDANYGEVIVRRENQDTQPFNNLSDGQRTMLAMVGDLAYKAATLNPQLGAKALMETPGIVLIDELDLHLHPQWQRHIIEDLRQTFPKVQFICTTHSPFLIQSLRSGEELIVLDGQPTAHLGDLSINEISQGIQGIRNPDVSARYEEMRDVARSYLEELEVVAEAPEAQLAAYKEKLAESIAPYADNPAFQAFLEMKLAAKLGG